jgi:hypothetical protein
MHFKYATISSTILVTFMYGMALPILFPIAMLTFLNMFFVDRIAITYWYQKPPMYGPELNRIALRVLCIAPILFFSFGYWIMGN